MSKSTPDLSKIEAGEPFELARTRLVERLRERAAECKLTHGQIAELTGFQRQNVTRVLGGKYPPTIDTFLKIADAVGLKVSLLEK